MKLTSIGLLAAGAIALAVLGFGRSRAPTASSPAAATVSAAGVTLTSTTIALPVDDGQFPAGANADLVNGACTACHSAAMALSQPPLSADQWQAEVTKMREVYRAPIPASDVPAIVAYLAAMPGQSQGTAPQRKTM